MIVTPDLASAPVVLPATVTVAALSDYDPGPLTDGQELFHFWILSRVFSLFRFVLVFNVRKNLETVY